MARVWIWTTNRLQVSDNSPYSAALLLEDPILKLVVNYLPVHTLHIPAFHTSDSDVFDSAA